MLNVDRRRFNVPPTRLFLGYLTRCIARRPMCCARCVILMTLFNNITVYDGYRQGYDCYLLLLLPRVTIEVNMHVCSRLPLYT